MAGIVEIRDTRQESPNGPQILAVTLTDLLKCIAPEGRKLTWTILDSEAVARTQRRAEHARSRGPD